MKLLLALCATSLALPIQFVFVGDTPTIRLGSSETPKPRPLVTTDEQQPPLNLKPTFQQYVERLRLELPSAAKGSSPDGKWPAESESNAHEGALNDKKYGALLGNPSKSTGEQHQASPLPSIRRYGTFLDKDSKFVELHGPRPDYIQSRPSRLDSEPNSSLGRLYGTFLGGMDNLMPSENHPKNALAKSRKKGLCDSSQPVATYLNLSGLADMVDNHGPECVGLAIFVLAPLAYLVLELLEMLLRCCTREKYPERGRDRVRLAGPERQLRVWSNRQREMFLEEKQWWQARKMRS